MAKPTDSQIKGMYGAIEELRTSFSAFEHIVNAHLDEFGKHLKCLEKHTHTQTESPDQTQDGQRSILAVKSCVWPLESDESLKVSALPPTESQLRRFENQPTKCVQNESKHSFNILNIGSICETVSQYRHLRKLQIGRASHRRNHNSQNLSWKEIKKSRAGKPARIPQ